MKKIINGKLYNTETAKFCGNRWNGLSVRDFGYLSEDLYKKKTGEFFLYGHGGPSTKYAESCGNMWSDGEAITPMTEADAKAWAERYLSADEYIEIFGEPEE